MLFKLFSNLVNFPDAIIIIAFAALLFIIILVKIDKLEKSVKVLEDEISKGKVKIDSLEEERDKMNNELDIIDKFLMKDSKGSFEKASKKDNKSMKQSVKAPKISSIMSLEDNEQDKK